MLLAGSTAKAGCEERGSPRDARAVDKASRNHFLFWAHVAGLNHECTAFVSGSICWANSGATPFAALGVVRMGPSSFLRATSRDTPNDAPRAGAASKNISSDEDPGSAPVGPV